MARISRTRGGKAARRRPADWLTEIDGARCGEAGIWKLAGCDEEDAVEAGGTRVDGARAEGRRETTLENAAGLRRPSVGGRTGVFVRHVDHRVAGLRKLVLSYEAEGFSRAAAGTAPASCPSGTRLWLRHSACCHAGGGTPDRPHGVHRRLAAVRRGVHRSRAARATLE